MTFENLLSQDIEKIPWAQIKLAMVVYPDSNSIAFLAILVGLCTIEYRSIQGLSSDGSRDCCSTFETGSQNCYVST